MRRRPAPARLRWTLGALAALACFATPALAQAVDCTTLRARIDESQRPNDTGQLAIAIRQQRSELDRVQAYADDSGCDDASPFDDPDTPLCRTLKRRLQQLQSEVQHLQDLASRSGSEPDDRRRGLIEQFNAYCGAAGDETVDPGPHDGASRDVPVDPGAAPSDDTPAPSKPVAEILCVRHCDGAYYPLAVEVPADQVEAMDKICKAQCPNAEASAFSKSHDQEIGEATGPDGASYSSLPAAFRFRTAVAATCSCRAPHQSWADALAQADSLLEPQKGDVTVTPEIAATMSQPIAPPRATVAPNKAGTTQKPAKKAVSAPLTPTPPSAAAGAVQSPNPGEDITRQFRRSLPTL